VEYKSPKLVRMLRETEEVLRETDRIRADAQRGVELARRSHYPERRRRDRRSSITDTRSAAERRLTDRRRH
jgi:hypothetical protein